MRQTKLNELMIGNKVAKIPIVQGGMGVGISMSRLAAAVANEGGIGVISAAGVGMFYKKHKDFEKNNVYGLRQEIIKAKSMSKGIIGVNIMVALTNFSELVKAAIDEEIDIIFAGAGLALDLPKYLTETSTTKLIPIVSSGRAARLLTRKWLTNYNYLPDAFVLEGPLAGGHLGFKKDQLDSEDFNLEKLLRELKEAILPFEEEQKKSIPVIVGGGIYTGEDIFYFLDKGAEAVQMATRFVTTDECDADIGFKQAYLNAKKEDIVFIDSPVGLPGRAINNEFLIDVKKGLKHPFTCPYNCIITCEKEKAPYCITLALINAKNGKLKNGFAFAGANAYLADKIISVKELMNTLKNEFETVFKKKYKLSV
ncbi:MAG: nitronate monooxygenase [Candidatus Izemoplasmatales bacterium]|nr:nitronate monooxygenase [Candidatus Izemoplasmatales bacterium]